MNNFQNYWIYLKLKINECRDQCFWLKINLIQSFWINNEWMNEMQSGSLN
jgi:hypothetical protein